MIQLVTVTGPSCAGKTTLTRRLLDTGIFCEVISFTTRPSRMGEVHGKDYYFIGSEDANDLIDSGKAAEHTTFKDYVYGIEKAEIDSKIESGLIPISIVEPNGLRQLRGSYPEQTFSIYVDNPLPVLFERFLGRLVKGVLTGKSVDVKYQTSRLIGMVDEQKNWNDYSYDFYISQFDSTNEKSVVDSLVKIFKK